jgi:sarcosine oxidase subunit beta
MSMMTEEWPAATTPTFFAPMKPRVVSTPVKGLYVNCGWGTGGFKATPGSGHVFAHTIANDNPHPINAPFTLERFRTGRLIDEAAAAAVAH